MSTFVGLERLQSCFQKKEKWNKEVSHYKEVTQRAAAVVSTFPSHFPHFIDEKQCQVLIRRHIATQLQCLVSMCVCVQRCGLPGACLKVTAQWASCSRDSAGIHTAHKAAIEANN